jgi:hypothetical protein
VLLTTGHPLLAVKLDEAGFPYLSKPFALDSLLLKSQAAIAEARSNILRVRASLEILKSRGQDLKDALKQSKPLMEASPRLMQKTHAEQRTTPKGQE